MSNAIFDGVLPPSTTPSRRNAPSVLEVRRQQLSAHLAATKGLKNFDVLNAMGDLYCDTMADGDHKTALQALQTLAKYLYPVPKTVEINVNKGGEEDNNSNAKEQLIAIITANNNDG